MVSIFANMQNEEHCRKPRTDQKEERNKSSKSKPLSIPQDANNSGDLNVLHP